MSTYVDPRTSITVIVGTLIGIAILLPFFSSGELKFKDRLNRKETAEAEQARKQLDKGHQQLLAKEYSSAKETIQKALDKLKELYKKDTEYHANGYLWLGKIAANDEEYDEAMRLYKKSLDLSDTLKSLPQPPKALSKVADSKMSARLKEMNTRLREAKLKSWVNHYCNCHEAIADLHREQKDYQKAVEVRLKVLDFVEKNAKEDSYLLKKTLQALATAYRDAGLSRDERKIEKRLSEMSKSPSTKG